MDLTSPFAIFSLLGKKPAIFNKTAVAIVYADGVIIDGGGSGIGSMFDSESIGSDTIREAMRTIAKDDSIKAVVIRINSPGGSALASEAMWQAVRRVAKDKPVIISIGNMAASGGYYLACAGDRIFADPSAIVGSIGVVGGKFVMKDLFDKLGITTATFTRGKNADLFGTDTEFTDRQRKMVKSWMTETYDQFTARVMTTRAGKIKKIEDVAQGRVFIAEQAKDLGMVDEIGGADKAIAYAAQQAHLKPEGYEVRMVPAAKTLLDLIGGTGLSAESPIEPKIQLAEDSVLKAMPKEIRSMIGEQLEILRLLQARPVVLAAPFAVREK
jgi:protease-4